MQICSLGKKYGRSQTIIFPTPNMSTKLAVSYGAIIRCYVDVEPDTIGDEAAQSKQAYVTTAVPAELQPCQSVINASRPTGRHYASRLSWPQSAAPRGLHVATSVAMQSRAQKCLLATLPVTERYSSSAFHPIHLHHYHDGSCWLANSAVPRIIAVWVKTSIYMPRILHTLQFRVSIFISSKNML